MASIIKGVLYREEAVGSLAVARQLLQNYSVQASGVVLLESNKTCEGIYHHYHRMDLLLCVLTGHLWDGEYEVEEYEIFFDGQRFDIKDGIIDNVLQVDSPVED